ncbi:MAG: complex I subunit 5 family protein [Candidatus Izemoplasmataceae bacterium]
MKKRQTDIVCVPRYKKIVGSFTVQSTVLVMLAFLVVALFIAGINGRLGMLSFLMDIGFIVSVLAFLNTLDSLPLIIILLPLIGSVMLIYLGRNSCFSRDIIVISMTLLTMVLSLFTYTRAIEGGLLFEIPAIMGLGLSFNVDMLSFTMLMITSVIWFIVMIYAHEYMLREFHCTRFFFFMGITYSAVLGTIMAGDLLTLFLFFEVMTFASYMLVIHGQKEESYNAGYNYIFMGIIGGFAILIALFLLYFTVGDLSFQSAIHTLKDAGSIKYWIIFLLIFGFGIKAGMAPVHVWLPRAHPVAPTPASALLSGIMIKLGAYGILRIATSYYFPAKGSVDSYTDPIWLETSTIGAGIIWIGIITMSIGVFFALQQSNIKRMLAYHSISQMGYIVMGIGVALYLGYQGAMGYAGAVYHIINHALFKSLLFMVAGVVYYHTGESDMYKLGGLWRKLPLTATVCLIAALGISGMPLFNGFISKSILHHGIVEAYEYGHSSFYYAELIFMVISAGTVCSFIKLFYYVFLRKMPEQYKNIKPEYNNLDTAMVAIALMIVLIGLNPHFILNTFIIPSLRQVTYDPYFIQNYIVDIAFFTGSDLLTMVIVIVLGSFIFLFGTKLHLFHLKLPYWLSLEYLIFYPMNIVIKNACKLMYGDQCPLNQDTLKILEVKNNKQTGFLDRFVIMANVFNIRYEAKIIKSDAFIYTVFITGILVFMIIMQLI